jgi:hypothetical protein
MSLIRTAICPGRGISAEVAPVMIETQQHVLSLGAFARALFHALQRNSPDPERAAEALRSALAGECVQCGIRLRGDELLALAQADRTEEPGSKLERLRQGYCARRSCDSYYYSLALDNIPGVDLEKVFSEAQRLQELVQFSADRTEAPAESRCPNLGWRRIAGVFLAIALIGSLWMALQWHRGDVIPHIRMPEHFEVDRFEKGSVPTIGNPLLHPFSAAGSARGIFALPTHEWEQSTAAPYPLIG